MKAPKQNGLLADLAIGVILQAWPLALFFATVSFFPFGVHVPLERVGQPALYVVVWTAIGLFIGFGRWQRSRATRDANPEVA